MLFLVPGIFYAQTPDESALSGLPDDTVKIHLLLELGEQYCSIENDKALAYLQEAFALATASNYEQGTGRSLLWQGRVYYYKDDYKLAEKYYGLAENAISKSDDKESMVLLSFFMGESCRIQGDYINALNHYKNVLELSKMAPNNILSSASYMAMGNILVARKDPVKALGYFREALRRKKEIGDNFGIACAMLQFGEAYEVLGQHDSSLFYYKKSLEIREQLGISRVIASSKYALAGLLISMGRYEEAIVYLLDARDRFASLDEKTGVCITSYRLAKAMNYLGNKEGIKLAEEAREMAAGINNPALVSKGFLILSEIFYHNGRYDEAYDFLASHKKMDDSLFTAEKERTLVEFEQKFQSEQKDNKIARLKDESKIQKQNILLLSISSFTLLAILFFVAILFRLKSQAMKKNALLMEQQSLIMTQESRIRENENRLLQEQLESKNRELASKALEMIRFNDTITSIIDQLEKLNSKPGADIEMSEYIKRIIHELENNNKQNIWNEFDKIFKNIHSGFYQRLLELCPDLTPTEIKTAALLKLNLTTKEIAAVTFKSEGGVKTTRYRLRKKLNLSSEDNLIPFLMQL
ncbi:MAG: tetratricopeptide repeat protein [Bacteroidetes bacterium]|nr:tetratricopeptide repeat protein [Bacteroidota bacterium]